MAEKKEINITIGKNIRNARERAKLTQEQLAERLDVSNQYISDAERGVVGVSIATLIKLCRVLGCSSDSLLFEDQSDNDRSSILYKRQTLPNDQFHCLENIVDSYIHGIDLMKKTIE